MENLIFNCEYEHLVGISLLPVPFEKKVELAKQGLTFSELENMLGPQGIKAWDDELKWADDDSEGVYKGHLFINDDDYPKSLLSYNEPPFCIAWRGNKPTGLNGSIKNAESLTIVGTREASDDGRRAAFLLALEASANNIVVYSGYATGIDQAAHHGSVAFEYPTFAVMPCGLNHSYSYRNRELVEGIYRVGGGFISQFCCSEEPKKWNFHYRNRILAQISDATVVVQAPSESGALITTREALDCGKDVFVHSIGNTNDYCSRGTNALVNDGAITISNYNDLKIYSLNSFKGSKYICGIDYQEIEKAIKAKPISHEPFYRFRDSWYHVCDKN